MHGVSALLHMEDCTLTHVWKDRVGFAVKVCNCSDLSKEIEVWQLLFSVFRPYLLDAFVVQGAAAHSSIFSLVPCRIPGKAYLVDGQLFSGRW
jgi:hypothetical protein